jgi:hypothetical protein
VGRAGELGGWVGSIGVGNVDRLRLGRRVRRKRNKVGRHFLLLLGRRAAGLFATRDGVIESVKEPAHDAQRQRREGNKGNQVKEGTREVLREYENDSNGKQNGEEDRHRVVAKRDGGPDRFELTRVTSGSSYLQTK